MQKYSKIVLWDTLNVSKFLISDILIVEVSQKATLSRAIRKGLNEKTFNGQLYVMYTELFK